MNPRTRRAALYAIGVIAIAASINALTHSYAGLYDWAIGHRLAGWQAMSWPAEIDVFLAIGELALYVAYLDAWPARQRAWPWATALIGLSVSVAGNIGHVQPAPGHPVILADRLTAATSPLAAFAGLYVGLLVLKMTRPHAQPGHEQPLDATNQPAQLAHPDRLGLVLTQPFVLGAPTSARPATAGSETPVGSAAGGAPGGHGLLREASRIYQAAAANGDRISQRALARQLRQAGHRFPNEHLHGIAATIGMPTGKAA